MNSDKKLIFFEIVISAITIGMMQGWIEGIVLFAILINILFHS